MSEQQAEQTSGEPGSLNAGPTASHSSDAQNQPAAATAPESIQPSASVDSPDLVPGQGAAEADAPNADATGSDTSKLEASRADAPHFPGKVIMMSSGDRAWDGHEARPEAQPGSGMFGKRRFAALAAVIALAVVAGALGGVLATTAVSRFIGDDVTGDRALEASVARIDADIVALKDSLEHSSGTALAQFNKTGDRLDKLEKAQAEPAAKLAKLSEAVDKLRPAPPAASAPVAATPAAPKEVTGSVPPPATAAAAAAPVPLPAPKPEVARLPTVEGWVLRDVAQGGALIEGRRGIYRGIYEVYAGDSVPGVGRIDAIRRQDGRWVVVTSKGLIVAR